MDKLTKILNELYFNGVSHTIRTTDSFRTDSIEIAINELVGLFTSLIPEPYLMQDDRDDVKRAGGWNFCRQEILSNIEKLRKAPSQPNLEQKG